MGRQPLLDWNWSRGERGPQPRQISLGNSWLWRVCNVIPSCPSHPPPPRRHRRSGTVRGSKKWQPRYQSKPTPLPSRERIGWCSLNADCLPALQCASRCRAVRPARTCTVPSATSCFACPCRKHLRQNNPHPDHRTPADRGNQGILQSGIG